MNELMNRYGPQIITGIIAICGIILGLFWNQFFDWRKHKRDQKAKLNHLLFHLLELHYFVKRHDFTDFVKLYLQMAEQRFGKLSEEDLKQVEQIIIPIFKEKINALSDSTEVKRLSKHYEAAVKEIASINPFLAYRLAGQSERLNTLKAMDDYVNSVRHLMPTEGDQMLLQNITDNYSSDKLIKEMVSDVRDSIINVSKEISIYKKMQSLEYLSGQEKSMSEEMKKEINNILDLIEKQINKQQTVF